jgi:hypothetical protein
MARRNTAVSLRRHHLALRKAHLNLFEKLRSSEDELGLSGDDFMNCVGAYTDFMGYKDDDETWHRWIAAVKKAWRREIQEKGDRVVLGDALDRAIRESTKAIGEFWPEDQPMLLASPEPNLRVA